MVRLGLVTSTLNAGQYLAQALSSVYHDKVNAASMSDHVLVDAGSTDETVTIASAFPVRQRPLPRSSLYEALNHGFRQIDAEVIGYLNADDYYSPGSLGRVIQYLRGNPGCRWLFGGVSFVNESGDVLGRMLPPRWLDHTALVGLGWLCVPQPAMFVRREAFDALGGFDTRYRFAADYDFVLRLLRDVGPPDRVSASLASFRLHANALTHQDGVLEEALRVRAEHSVNRIPEYVKGFLLRLAINSASPRLVASKLMGQLPLARSLRMPR